MNIIPTVLWVGILECHRGRRIYLNALLKQIDKQLESRRQALKLYEERLRGCGKHLQLHLPDAQTR